MRFRNGPGLVPPKHTLSVSLTLKRGTSPTWSSLCLLLCKHDAGKPAPGQGRVAVRCWLAQPSARAALCYTGGKADKHRPPPPAARMPRPLRTAMGERAGRLHSQAGLEPQPLTAQDRREPRAGKWPRRCCRRRTPQPTSCSSYWTQRLRDEGPTCPPRPSTGPHGWRPPVWLSLPLTPSLQATSCLHIAQPASSCLTHQTVSSDKDPP